MKKLGKRSSLESGTFFAYACNCNCGSVPCGTCFLHIKLYSGWVIVKYIYADKIYKARAAGCRRKMGKIWRGYLLQKQNNLACGKFDTNIKWL